MEVIKEFRETLKRWTYSMKRSKEIDIEGFLPPINMVFGN